MLKILINTPKISLPGGVANHYLGLKSYWLHNVNYNTVGKRFNSFFGKGIFYLPYDILKFLVNILVFKPDFVLLNPSLGKSAMVRDMTFLWLSKLFNFKTGTSALSLE